MSTTKNASESLLTEQQVAKLLNVSVATIRRGRLFRLPPCWIKLGASVRYSREAVDRLIIESSIPARPEVG